MDIGELRNRLQWLRGEDGVAPATEVESALGEILSPLLKAEGLQLLVPKVQNFVPIDFAAKPVDVSVDALSVAIKYKHYGGGKESGPEAVHQLLGAIASGPFDRALLISRFGFTGDARDLARRNALKLELHDLSTIADWIDRVGENRFADNNKVQVLVRSISHEFAKLVAENQMYLNNIEWRDLERVMERVMTGLGFEATLTPSSKDGGKDLILRCHASNREDVYIVELKHWRSGKPVVKGAVSEFINIVVSENRAGGLFLSTSGYASNVSEAITEITRQRFRLGDRTKIVTLCQTYVRAVSGLWSPPDELPEVLYEGLS